MKRNPLSARELVGAIGRYRWTRPCNVFRTAVQKFELYELSRRIAEFCHRRRISHLVLVDGSSRPAYAGILAFWKHSWPKEVPPQIWFINPKGFVFSDDSGSRRLSAISREFVRHYPGLYRKRSERMMLFDVCIHTGNTLRSILRVLGGLGFDKVSVGTASRVYAQGIPDIRVDICGLSKRPALLCYPFGVDELVTKETRVVSSSDIYLDYRQDSVALRREIRWVVETVSVLAEG